MSYTPEEKEAKTTENDFRFIVYCRGREYDLKFNEVEQAML